MVCLIAGKLFENGVTGWQQLFARWCPSHHADDPFSDVQDFMVEHATRTKGDGFSREVFGELFVEWVRESGIQSFFEESERWHVDWYSRSEAPAEISWNPLLASPMLVGDLVAHELCDTQMLLEEGGAMLHCIGSYAPLCAAGESHVFSVHRVFLG